MKGQLQRDEKPECSVRSQPTLRMKRRRDGYHELGIMIGIGRNRSITACCDVRLQVKSAK